MKQCPACGNAYEARTRKTCCACRKAAKLETMEASSLTDHLALYIVEYALANQGLIVSERIIVAGWKPTILALSSAGLIASTDQHFNDYRLTERGRAAYAAYATSEAADAS
jgi:hypothetical protein